MTLDQLPPSASSQNENASPNLVVIDPITGFTVQYTLAAKPPHGGGYDDMSHQRSGLP